MRTLNVCRVALTKPNYGFTFTVIDCLAQAISKAVKAVLFFKNKKLKLRLDSVQKNPGVFNNADCLQTLAEKN